MHWGIDNMSQATVMSSLVSGLSVHLSLFISFTQLGLFKVYLKQVIVKPTYFSVGPNKGVYNK